MINTAEIVAAIEQIQLNGAEVLVFVCPVDPKALEASGISKDTLEDRVQTALIAELNASLVPPRITCGVTIPGVGPCELEPDGHRDHRRGAVTWNGAVQ